MLTMPNVSSPTSLVPRPSLVVDSVRPATPPRAVEPTTAVSKERSRAESAVPDSSRAAPSLVYNVQGALPQQRTDRPGEPDPAAERSVQEAAKPEEPPAEKTEIQKAMEAQIKDLLKNVWKASAKAVDFLLQRQSEAAQSELWTGVLSAAAVMGGGSSKAANGKTAVSVAAQPEPDMVSYSPQGGRLTERSAGAGKFVNVLA